MSALFIQWNVNTFEVKVIYLLLKGGMNYLKLNILDNWLFAINETKGEISIII